MYETLVVCDECDEYEKSKINRQKHIDAILSANTKKKIVVAGPGTGKTYLFKEVLRGKSNSLTLTFINALVEDLSLDLCGISDVKTLHSFARGELARAVCDEIKIYPKLSEVIKKDAAILLDKSIDFDQIFYNLDDKNTYLEFYKKRKLFYDKYYGYTDVIFSVVKYFEKNKEKIPSYDQIVVDEFQDFNKLEVSLIDLLAEKSPVLLAGDDDQALYDFKGGSPKHIREKYSMSSIDYDSFTLPYCSRCTRVIIDATNDIIRAAIKNGNLKDRVNKDYIYFVDRNKDLESSSHPKIIYSQQYSRMTPWFIEKCIGEIAKHEKGTFTVLIVSPTKSQIQSVVSNLKNKGFLNIQSVDKNNSNGDLLDGLKILLDNSKSNLGWRLVSKCLLDDKKFNNILKATQIDENKRIIDCIDTPVKKEVFHMLKTLRAIKSEGKIDEKGFNLLLEKIDLDPYKMAKNYLKDEITLDPRKISNAGLRKIPIKATTVQSSKGLSAEYVFIINFDDQYFIKNKDKKKISDWDICNFLVALTRAKKKVFLVSSNTKRPIFLRWISENRIEFRGL